MAKMFHKIYYCVSIALHLFSKQYAAFVLSNGFTVSLQYIKKYTCLA